MSPSRRRASRKPSPIVQGAEHRLLAAFPLAFGQILAPELRRPLFASLLWSALVFVLLWLGLGVLIDTNLGSSRSIEAIVQVLGGLASFVLAWLMFPAVATMILSCYAETIIRAVERRHYPWLDLPPPTPWTIILTSGLRLVGLTLLVNIVALPLYLLFPGINYLVFCGLNGYLLARENFDLVALRRLGRGQARALWQAHRLAFIFSGMVIAGLFSIPIANLTAPIVGIAVAVHLVERLRNQQPADPRLLHNRSAS
jgi:CysZ protein